MPKLLRANGWRHTDHEHRRCERVATVVRRSNSEYPINERVPMSLAGVADQVWSNGLLYAAADRAAGSWNTSRNDFSHESVDIGAILLHAWAAVALLVEVDR